MTPIQSARLPGKSGAVILSACLMAAGVVAGEAAPVMADVASEAAPAGGASRADELAWARNALARNGALEVVSTDPATGIITVRVRSTGELRRVRADDVIAALPPELGSKRSDRVPAAPAGERVIASGPGYTIAAVGPAAGAAATGAMATGAAGSGAAASGAASEPADTGPARNLPVEHRHEPLICQGARLLHIDSRNLVFDGDAVSAEQGCELHITNSSITAKGVGIAARSASVHIDNSIIAGGNGAIDASDGAQVYARSSTFKGLIRRADAAAFHDLGGNVGD